MAILCDSILLLKTYFLKEDINIVVSIKTHCRLSVFALGTFLGDRTIKACGRKTEGVQKFVIRLILYLFHFHCFPIEIGTVTPFSLFPLAFSSGRNGYKRQTQQSALLDK